MSFEIYRNEKRIRQGKCCICGEPSEGRVVVTLQSRAERSERSPGVKDRYYYPSIASRSGSYCEAHGIEIFEQAARIIKANGRAEVQGT